MKHYPRHRSARSLIKEDQTRGDIRPFPLGKTMDLIEETRVLCASFEADAREEGREFSPELRALRQGLDEAPGKLAGIAAEQAWLDSLSGPYEVRGEGFGPLLGQIVVWLLAAAAFAVLWMLTG